MNAEISVLLVEEDLDTLSVVSLSLAELKGCRLNIQSAFVHALNAIDEEPPNLILFAHVLEGNDSLKFLSEVHRKYPAIYTIVSLPQQHQEMSATYMEAGVYDWIVKDKNYIPTLIAAVKNALTRIAERESVDLPQMVQADQLALEENLADVVFVLDADGKFLHVNRAVSDLLEYEQNDVIQKPLRDFLQSAGKFDFEEFIKSGKPGQKLRGAFSIRKGNGVIAEFEMNAAIQDNCQIHGVLRKEEDWQFGDEAAEALSTGFAPLEETHPDIDVAEEEGSIPARLGPYRVITMLGAGSMGRVYKGFDDQLDRPVAIKVISQALARDPDYLERFQKEARILASISHPNIALIYFLDRNHKPPFFCMEYMPGGSLEDLLQQKKKLDPELAVSYTMQVAIGLDEAYKRGIVHQDIKPSNLMIAENERLKIVDFGLARTSREIEEGPQVIAGTPLYIAPEQVQEGRTDFRSDIYSLGVTFFRMLYGRTPFSGGSLVEILYNQFHQGLPPKESLDPDVPAELYTIIQGMISTDLSRRYNSYSDLIQDLETARRSMMAEPVTEQIAPPHQAEIILRGLLYDQPFAEVLGEILRKNLSGKLTLSWKDLYKNIFVENGKIVGVLSNQEGENFLELLLEKNRISPKKAREIGRGSIDLYLNYSTALGELPSEARRKLGTELQELSWKILNGLFSWLVGEVIFESSQTPARMMIQIPLHEALIRGVKETADFNFIRRRLFWGKCRIRKSGEFQKNLMALKMKSSDTFMLFRFDDQIPFAELLPLTGLPEEEFYRLIYLFLCSDVLKIEELQAEITVPREVPKRRPEPGPKPLVIPLVEVTKPVEAKVLKPPEPPKETKPSIVKTERVAASTQPPKTVKPAPKSTSATPAPTPPDALPPAKEPAAMRPDPLAQKLQSSPAELAKYYYNCALESFNQKNYWATVEYCNKTLVHKKDAQTYRLMGNAFSTHPKFRLQALDAYKKALELDPKNAATIRDLADFYYSAGSHVLAKARYQDVLVFNPDDSQAKLRLSELKHVKK